MRGEIALGMQSKSLKKRLHEPGSHAPEKPAVQNYIVHVLGGVSDLGYKAESVNNRVR